MANSSIKTFVCNSEVELDYKVNKFSENHQVFATQTHVLLDKDGHMRFIATCFFR